MIKIALYLKRVSEYELKITPFSLNCFFQLAGLIEEHLD